MAPTDDLLKALQNFDPTSLSGDEPERVRVREALYEAWRKTQSPWDVAWEHNWITVATSAATKTLFDMGIFQAWHDAGWKHQTTDELAAMTSTDPKLLRRLLRHVSAHHLLNEVGLDTYGPTEWAKAFVTHPFLVGPYGEFYHINTEVFNKLPKYLASIGYKNPDDPKNCNFQFTYNGASPWEVFSATPELNKSFNQGMESHSRFNLHSWTSIYPTETIVEAAKEKAAQNGTTEGVLVVDVGGNKGYDLEKFRATNPQACQSGSLVLQDLPDVLKDVPEGLHDAIKVVPYDFFTEQETKGARAYLMHNILHDWSDDLAIKILKNVSAGFEKGYSRLLLHESIVDEVKPKSKVTTSDMHMLAVFSSKERTEVEWNEVLSGAGLRLVKIWRPKEIDLAECIIEAELA